MPTDPTIHAVMLVPSEGDPHGFYTDGEPAPSPVEPDVWCGALATTSDPADSLRAVYECWRGDHGR